MNAGGAFAIFAILAIIGIGFWIWALVDAVKVPDDYMYRAGNKLVWVLVIVLAGWIGAIVYLAVGRPEQGRSAPIAPNPGADASGMPPPPVRPD